MIYMVKVFVIVAVPIFGLAGAMMLALLAWDEVGRYARARREKRRLEAVASSERIVIREASFLRMA